MAFIKGRLVRLIFLATTVMLLSFLLLAYSPFDPVTAYVGANPKVSAEQRALIAAHWGLDQPPLVRFSHWLKSALSGDLGISMVYRKPVIAVIKEKFLASLALMSVAWLISGVAGFLLGILSGMHEGKWLDRVIHGYCYILISTPTFWMGIMFIMVFSVYLGWFPLALSVPIGTLREDVVFLDRLRHLVLPALTLGLTGIANICLHTRQKVIDTLQTEYVLFAKARGETRTQICLNHVVRNVSLPAVTLQFLSISELFGGAIFIEQVFSYPGLGSATVLAGLRGDLPLLMGIVLISLLFVFTGNTVADLLYQWIDPRLKEASSHG